MTCRPLTAQEKKKKLQKIQNALNNDPVDIPTLKKLAIERGGFINDEYRRKAWPKVLNIDIFDSIIRPGNLEEHKYYQQVLLDVNRSGRRFPENMSANQREIMQKQLLEVILWVLSAHPELHYYQGYHDICVTFLLVCGQKLTYRLMDKLSCLYLRDFMCPTMEKTSKMLNFLVPIVRKSNEVLAEFLEECHVGTIFALSWLITWFSHVLSDGKQVLRLYDFFLVSHPLMPVYLAAQIVLFQSDDILSKECDMAAVHHFLSKLPPNLPMEQLISDAGDLFLQFPPESLGKEALRHYHESLTVATFKNFELVGLQQRPDHVLRLLKERGVMLESATNDKSKNASRVNGKRVTAILLSSAIGAAAWALANISIDVLDWF